MPDPRKRLPVVFGLAALVIAAVVIPTATASSSHLVSTVRHHACGRTVKAIAGQKVVINQYFQEELRYSPGTLYVNSGCTLTFSYGSPGQTDPHTLTIVPAARLPKTVSQVNNCAVCKVALGHLKNPSNPNTAGTPANPLIHPILHAGKPNPAATLDGVAGDSVAIEPVAGHRNITVTVTAKSGTTLYFLCAIHPWMQGKLVVR